MQLTNHQFMVLAQFVKPVHAYAAAQQVNASHIHAIPVETCYRTVGFLHRAYMISFIEGSNPPQYQLTAIGARTLREEIIHRRALATYVEDALCA